MTNRIQTDYLNISYPPQPGYNNSCELNEIYQTLPQNWPRENVAFGPTSMKHLYTGIPNFYPVQMVNKPLGTLYEADLSIYGPGGKRISYHPKLYPLTNRYVREVNDYADFILPYPDLRANTIYSTVRDAKLADWKL